MSREVDEKVVSMQFDNKNFERNVNTSISTLDRLKNSLKLDGAVKGFSALGKAADSVNMSGLSSAVETVQTRFSALDVMAVTALANITNAAINAGKHLLASFTIEPIKTGFNEFELKMGSIQTIMASTGESLDTVNRYLNELNEYSDRTIYSFADMTQNIGKFTNAGVKLEDAVLAIKGISNEAAVSGANANEASRAMYNFAQALSAGYVKLIDWKSIEIANMSTVEFRQELINAAVAAGTLTDAGDGLYRTLDGNVMNATKNFNDTLQDQWMTTEVLINTLKNYADETTEIGKKAYASAQDVKTFSMMMDTLKEAAQSGWAQTWELIIGDFEQGKTLWTKLSEIFGDIISKSAESRNNLLRGALQTSKWDEFIEKVNDAGIATEDFESKIIEVAKEHGIRIDELIEQEGSLRAVFENGRISAYTIVQALKSFAGVEADVSVSTENMTDKLEEFQILFDKVWRGDFGNGTERINRMTEAGYDYAAVQALVNKHTSGTTLTLEDLTEVIDDMSDSQLENMGYTEDQINAIRDLAEQAEQTGTPINELIASLEKPTGRELLFESLMNSLEAVKKVLGAVNKAWVETFPPITSEQIYTAIEALNSLSKKLILSDDNINKLIRTFKGLFAIVDLFITLTSGSLRLAFKILCSLFNISIDDILEITAHVGDCIVAFRDWIDSTLDVSKAFENLKEAIGPLIDRFNDWIDSLKDSDNLPRDIAQGIVNGVGEAFKFFLYLIDELKNSVVEKFNSIPGFMTEGFVNGIWDGIKIAGQVMIELGKIIIDKIKDVLGIHSPSVVFYGIAVMCLMGFALGIKEYGPQVWETMKEFGEKLVEYTKEYGPKVMEVLKEFGGKISEFVKNMRLGTIIAAAIASFGFFKLAKGITDAISAIAYPLVGLGKLLDSVSELIDRSSKSIKKVIERFGKVLSSVGNYINAQALMILAESIFIIAGALVILTLVDQKKLLNAAVILGTLMLCLGMLAKSVNNFGVEGLKKFIQLSGMIAGFSAAVFLMAVSMKILGSMDGKEMQNALIGVTSIAGIVVALIAVSKYAREFDNRDIGVMILEVAGAMVLMALVVKSLGRMDPLDLLKGVLAIDYLSSIIIALIFATKLANGSGGMDNIAKTILGVAGAMVLMALVVKVLGNMNAGQLAIGLIAMTYLAGIVTGLIAATRLAGKDNIALAGTTIAGVGFAMLMLAVTTKILGSMTVGELAKGIIAVASLAGIVTGLIAATKLAGEGEMVKIGAMLILMSVSIGIIAGISILLGLVDVAHLAKGIIAVGLLATMMAGLIYVTKNATDCYKTIASIAATIAVMAVALVALSFIDTAKLAATTGCLSAVIGMFALLIASTHFATDATKTIIAMAAVVGLIGVMLYDLSQLPTNNVLSSALALSAVMVAMSACLLIVSKIGDVGTNAIKGVLLLTAMVVPMAAFGAALWAMGKWVTNAEKNAVVLIALMTSMTVLLAVLTVIGNFWLPALAGVACLTAMIFPMMAFLFILATLNTIANAQQNIMLITFLMTTMTMLLVQLSLVAPLALIAVAAIQGLTFVITEIAVLATAIGAIMEKVPELQGFLDAGLPVLEKICGSIGTMFGNLIAGFAEAVMSALPGIADSLTEFMVRIQPFLLLSQLIPDNLLEKVGLLTGAILALTVAELLNALTQFFTLGYSLPDLGTDLSDFATNIQPFLKSMKTIDPAQAEAAKSLASMILVLTSAELLNGIASLFGIDVSFSDFGDQLEDFGEAICTFSNTITDNGGINSSAVTAASNAGKVMAELAKAIPSSGDSIISRLVGQKDLGVFGTQVESFGKAICGFSNAIVENGGIDSTAVQAAADAGNVMAELAKSIPSTGPSVVGFFCGDHDLSTFGFQVKEFGKYMCEFSNVLTSGTYGTIDQDAIDACAKAGGVMAELAGIVGENAGGEGVIAWFTGEQSLSDFGDNIVLFGEAMMDFSKEITKDGGINQSAVETVQRCGTMMADLAGVIPEDDTWFFEESDMETFGNNIVAFGEAMMDFSESVEDLDASIMTSVVEFGNDMVDLSTRLEGLDYAGIATLTTVLAPDYFIDDLVSFSESAESVDATVTQNVIDICTAMADLANIANGVDFTVIENFKTAFSKMGDLGVDTFITTIDAANSKITQAAANIITMFTNALNSKRAALITAITATFTGALIGMQTEYPQAKTAGIKMIDAYIEGMKSNQGTVKTTFAEIVTNAMSNVAQLNSNIKVTASMMMVAFTAGLVSKRSLISNTFTAIVKLSIIVLKSQNGEFKSIGAMYVVNFANGMLSKSRAAMSAASNVAKASSSNLKSQFSSFYDAGKYLVQGFAAGISSNSFRAVIAATAMANAAKQAAKNALKINSPSKVFRAIGTSVPEGFAQGIVMMGDAVKNSSIKMSETAIDSAKNSLSSISDVLNSGEEIKPSITPVVNTPRLDSRNFDLGTKLDVTLNQPINSLSDIISKAQADINASNKEVIDAITGLREDLNSIYSGNDTEVALYVDSKKLASSLARPMSVQLNMLSKRGAY